MVLVLRAEGLRTEKACQYWAGVEGFLRVHICRDDAFTPSQIGKHCLATADPPNALITLNPKP